MYCRNCGTPYSGGVVCERCGTRYTDEELAITRIEEYLAKEM